MENIALNKPVRSNLNNTNAYRAVDGKDDTYWEGIFFPSYIEVDLLDNYRIKEISLEFMDGMAFYYTLYGSKDGVDFARIYKSHSDQKKYNKDRIEFKDIEYRFVRVYIEYNDTCEKAYLKNIAVYGDKLNNNTDKYEERDFFKITGIEDFDESIYARDIGDDEVYETVYGVIDRTIGKEYREWFSFELENTSEDFFELSDRNKRIHIRGNKGVCLTSGLNYYYKHYLGVSISENARKVDVKEFVGIGETIRKKTDFKIRYALNYCTLSYTFAFVSYDRWLEENDYLALNGINVVLDLAGEEAVWIKFLMNYNYTYKEAKDFLVGPAYNAWQLMDNMEVFGGPLNDHYIQSRVEMGRMIQRYRRALGIETVFQGYAGMVPTDFNNHMKDIRVKGQGIWNGFNRPSMIMSDSKDYDDMAEAFYEAQRYIFGDTSRFFAVDPFHEGGIREEGLSDEVISREVLSSMLKYRKDAIWVIQSWWSNPTNELLKGMGELKNEHALIIDLISYPLGSNLAYQKTEYYDTRLEDTEFNHTAWVWALLGNFGGNPSMNGQFDEMVRLIKEAKTYQYMCGIGMISEATYDNPMVYSLLFDLIFEDIEDTDKWMKEYLNNRYGMINDDIYQAFKMIKENNYALGVRMIDQVIDIRTSNVVKHKNYSFIHYPYSDLYESLRLLFKYYDELKDVEGYRYDLSEISRQLVCDYMSLRYNEVNEGRYSKEDFLKIFDILNGVLKTNRIYLVGDWIKNASDLGKNFDDFTVDSFIMNAKSLITTWGSIEGSLIDYAFRTYEGLLIDVYKENYILYFNHEEDFDDASKYARRYFKWVLDDKQYQIEAVKDDEYRKIMSNVLDECRYEKKVDADKGNLAYGKKVYCEDNLKVIDLEGIYDIIRADFDDVLYISENGIDYREIKDNRHIYQRGRFIKGIHLEKLHIYGNRALATINDLRLLLDSIDVRKCHKEIYDRALKSIENNEAIDTVNSIYWSIAKNSDK